MIVLMIMMNITWMLKVKMTMLLFSSCLLRHSSPLLSVAAQVYLWLPMYTCRCPCILVATQVYLLLPKYTPNWPNSADVNPLLLSCASISITHLPHFSLSIGFFHGILPIGHSPFLLTIAYFHGLFPIGHCFLQWPIAHRLLHIRNLQVINVSWSQFALDVPPP